MVTFESKTNNICGTGVTDGLECCDNGVTDGLEC